MSCSEWTLMPPIRRRLAPGDLEGRLHLCSQATGTLILSFFATLFLSACAGFTTAGNKPPPNLDQLTASTTSVTFGDVLVGSSASQDITLTNTGGSSVTISKVTISGTSFSASGVNAGQTLTSGQSATLTVAFAPPSTGSFTGSVAIASNATSSPTISLFGGSHSVSLSWSASTSTVVGYYVYRGTVSGGPYMLLNSSPVAATAYTDTALASGQTYYYVVTAVDSSGAQSGYSNEASAAVPVP